jgi:ribonuclease Z
MAKADSASIMLPFEVTILGSSSALPAYGRHPSGQSLNIHDQYYLIDCGEGTQMQLDKFGIKRSKLNQLFITHLHGDHIFGILPLLTTFSLLRRPQDLHIYGPRPIKEFIEEQLRILDVHLSYELHIHEINHEQASWIFSDRFTEVKAFPLQHRVPTIGYLFKEKIPSVSILPEQLEKYGIHYSQIPLIREGKPVQTASGDWVPAEQVSKAASLPRTYAYCSDTKYFPELVEQIKDVTLLYHEATFAEALANRAQKTMHSTASQAAQMAKDAGADQLLIGHFSTRYTDLNQILKEARTVFPNTQLALEGETFQLSQLSEDQ